MTDSPNTPLRPVAGVPAAKALTRSIGTETAILLTVFGLLGLWAAAIVAFGWPALIWPMKVIVPGMIAMLILITRG